MQFDFKEKAKKRQDRNSPIKPFFVYNLKIHPKFHGVNSKFLWGLFSPHGVPPFLTAPTKVWLPKSWRCGFCSARPTFSYYVGNIARSTLRSACHTCRQARKGSRGFVLHTFVLQEKLRFPIYPPLPRLRFPPLRAFLWRHRSSALRSA